MPELPEVETVCRGLAPAMVGARIAKATFNRPDLRIPFPSNFSKTLQGSTITAITRRAKYLLFTLDQGGVVLAHLGMSGKMLIMPRKAYQPQTHDHVLWDLCNGQRFVFNDARRFGVMTYLQVNEVNTHPLLAHLAPEPLGNRFNEAYLADVLACRKVPLKQALMDQSLVVGVGNIYASEALFLSRISPFMPAYQAQKSAGKLVQSIQAVLHAAIESGGSTLRDYVRSSGDMGYFQHQFQVYGREGEACYTCSTPISRAVQAGRSTFYCVKCQNVS